jgi:hypothetical protein
MQQIRAEQEKALQSSNKMRGISVAAQSGAKSAAAHEAKLHTQQSEAISMARVTALKAKMLAAQARLRVSQYHRLLNVLNRKYQALKDARATTEVQVRRYQSAFKRLSAARALFEAASGKKLPPIAYEDRKFKTMSRRIQDALLSSDSVIKMAKVAGDVDHTLDGVGSAGSHLGTATAETIRAETLEHLLGVAEKASDIRAHSLQHLLGIADAAKKLEVGTLGELRKQSI